jgi:hypothetical protein
MNSKRYYSDMAIEANGNILTLVCGGEEYSPYRITRCDPLGHPIDTLELKNIPTLYATDFFPNSLIAHNGFICLTDKETMKIVVADCSGNFVEGHDIGACFPSGKNNEPVTGITDVSVDAEGAIVCTLSAGSPSPIISLSSTSMKSEGCSTAGTLPRHSLTGLASLPVTFTREALDWIFTAVCMITKSSFFCNAND